MIMNEQVDLHKIAIEEIARQTARKIQADILWQKMLDSYKDWHTFEMPDHWERSKHSFCSLDDWLLENFGEPGDRYIMHPDPNKFDYLFRDPADLAWMILKWR